MTQEERAEIARRNGAKGRGPVTPEGKRRSAANSIRTGEYARLLRDFVPPHAAVLCNQDRQAYYRAAEKFIKKYNPVDDAESHIVSRIVEAEWRIELINRILAGIWNREIVRQFQGYASHLPEVRELLSLLDATEKLADRTRFIEFARAMIREQDRIVSTSERRLLQMRRVFAAEGIVTNRSAFREPRPTLIRSPAPVKNEPGANRVPTGHEPAANPVQPGGEPGRTEPISPPAAPAELPDAPAA